MYVCTSTSTCIYLLIYTTRYCNSCSSILRQLVLDLQLIHTWYKCIGLLDINIERRVQIAEDTSKNRECVF